jgi:EmrB/QacA subfamily drug resistance transporter
VVLREQVRPQQDPKVAPVVWCLTLAIFVAALDQTVVATSLPVIAARLGGIAELAWVVSAYLLAICLSTPLHGKLGDLYGRKWLFLIALVLFLAGSVLCGFSRSMTQLVVFRFLQGAGAGGIFVNSWAVIGDLVPPARQGKYQGSIQGAYALATASGPLLGGVLTDTVGWRWVFYINIPLCVIALAVIAARLSLPARERPRPVIDWWGVALVSAGTGTLVLAVSLGGTRYRWTSAPVLALAVVTVPLLAAAFLAERRAREPLLPPHLFGNDVIRVAIVLAFILGFATECAATFVPLLQQVVDGVSPTVSGLRMMPFWISWTGTSALCHRAIDRTGRYRRFPVTGTGLLVIGMLALSCLDAGVPYGLQAAVLAVIGSGFGMMSSVMVRAAQNAAEPEDTGVAISTTTFSRTMGLLLGVTFCGTVFSAVLSRALRHAISAGIALDPVNVSPGQIGALPPGPRGIVLGAFGTALRDVFLCGAMTAAVGFLIALRLRDIPLRTETKTAKDG